MKVHAVAILIKQATFVRKYDWLKSSNRKQISRNALKTLASGQVSLKIPEMGHVGQVFPVRSKYRTEA